VSLFKLQAVPAVTFRSCEPLMLWLLTAANCLCCDALQLQAVPAMIFRSCKLFLLWQPSQLKLFTLPSRTVASYSCSNISQLQAFLAATPHSCKVFLLRPLTVQAVCCYP
jgi:hypothetical protein